MQWSQWHSTCSPKIIQERAVSMALTHKTGMPSDSYLTKPHNLIPSNFIMDPLASSFYFSFPPHCSASLGQKFTGPHPNRKKLDVVVCVCLPSHGKQHKTGGSQSREKGRSYLQNNQSKKGLEVWLKQ
jgi:hypothetical protein